MVSGSFSLLCSRFFSPFLHSTGALSVSREYLALRDGPRKFVPDFSCPALLRIPTRCLCISPTGLSPSMIVFSNTVRLCFRIFCVGPSTPTPPKRHRFGLFRVRSPLLAESFLFSFPAGSEMFQFPAFAYRFAVYQLALMGCPIRRSAGRRIFAPLRSFSQLITSFFASESLGIHLSPFFTSVLSHLSMGAGYILALLVSCPNMSMSFCSCELVENNGFEPLTLCLQSRCSSQLS